jgi:hypothetical protein
MKKLYLKSVLIVICLAIASVSASAQTRLQSRAEFEQKFPQLNLVNLDSVPMIVRVPNTEEWNKFSRLKAEVGPGAGCVMDVNLGMSDGIWTEVDSKRIWTLCISAPENFKQVRSIWVLFRNVRLARGAVLYAYSLNGEYVERWTEQFNVGSNRNGICTASVERDSTVVVQIVEPANSTETSTLNIPKISVKTWTKSPALSYVSAECEVDVCGYGYWKKDSYGICKIEYKELVPPLYRSYQSVLQYVTIRTNSPPATSTCKSKVKNNL